MNGLVALKDSPPIALPTSMLLVPTPSSSFILTKFLLDAKSPTQTLSAPCVPAKPKRYRIRMTVGGDRLDAYQNVRSPAVGITDTKLHINSTISYAKNGARYCTGDLKAFFLCSIMKIFQYMRVHRRYIPQEILDAYNLNDTHFDSKGYAYLEIRKGKYGLKEASILAYNQLKEHLALYGYAPVRVTPGLWRHNTRRTVFTLAVDDFLVLNISARLMLTIFFQRSKTSMDLPKIGQATIILG
jgi:hypothetical protein